MALAFLTTLFFAWGFITVLNDILIPHFKNLFDLSYFEASLIQFIFFFAYFVMSMPASVLVKKLGYRKGIVAGLALTGLGAFLFYPASMVISYPFFLAAFFVLASGITVLQVSANPYVTELGDPDFAASRLNLTQGFNSLGTALAPIFGSILILSTFTFFPFYHYGETELIVVTPTVSSEYGESFRNTHPSQEGTETLGYMARDSTVWICSADTAYHFHEGDQVWDAYPLTGQSDQEMRGILVEEKAEGGSSARIVDQENLDAFRQHEAETVQWPYIGIGAVLFLLALVFLKAKLPTIKHEEESTDEAGEEEKGKSSMWKFPHLLSGAVAIFMYVGAEVAIGSFLILFWKLPEIADMPEREGGFYVALYWLSAMVGRFAGALLQRYIKPNRVLAASAAAAFILVACAILGTGTFAMWSIILVGLFNSIMFPTIFSLSVNGLGKHTSSGSGLLISMIVGGAVVPLLFGLLADMDSVGIQNAFFITLICYAYIVFFAVKGYRLKSSTSS